MIPKARRIAALLAVALAVAALPATGRLRPAGSPIAYRLRIADPASHLFDVTISAATLGHDRIDFQMPAWSPGRYVIFDFARNVQEVSAVSSDGLPLATSKIDKQTWRVETAGAAGLEFRYRVFADDLSGTFSQLDERHALVNGPSVYMYVVDRKPDPVVLTIEAPKGWRAMNGAAESPGQTLFEWPNYDQFIDTPTEISPSYELRSFRVGAAEYRVLTHQIGKDREKPDRFVADVEKIVRAEVAFMGQPDLERYTLLFHFDPSADLNDGMEHLYSTVIVRTASLDEEKRYDGLLVVTAHEIFHIWNVKRLRPLELGPWDYTKENYTTSLWIGEGLTNYYGDLSLLRAGIWNERRFLDALGGQITVLQAAPGRRLMSLEQASFDTWLYMAAASRQRSNGGDISFSYYMKGQVVGALLDLEIRHRTGNTRSLDDVMRLLYRRFYVDAPAETYYLKGRGYKGADFLAAVNEVSGSNFSGFFSSYVSGTSELDYGTILGYAGLRLKPDRSAYSSTTIYDIAESPNATDEQRAFRRAWLSQAVTARSAS